MRSRCLSFKAAEGWGEGGDSSRQYKDEEREGVRLKKDYKRKQEKREQSQRESS
jgi:hypothetical protein